MNTTQKLTRTAILLAMTLAFQSLRYIPVLSTPVYGTYIIGSLVNLAIIFSVSSASLGSAIFISIVTPFVAFIQGHVKLPLMIPVIALGNILFCVIFYYFKKVNKYAGIAIGAVLKWVFLYHGAKVVFSFFMKMPQPQLTAALAAFNIPQLITALIGGFFSIVIYQLLPDNIKNVN